MASCTSFLRHSFLALLDKSGATLKEAMQLARHSDPKLTMAVYGRAQLHDLASAVERFPSLMLPASESEPLRATGTDSADRPRLANQPDRGTSQPRTLTALLTVGDDFRCEPMGTHDNASMGKRATGDCHNPFAAKVAKNECERMGADKQSSPSTTRTYNLPVNSRLLYH
jgi:hypothetical protein